MDKNGVRAWIKEGMVVRSIHYPDVKMVVDRIERKTTETPIKTDVPGLTNIAKNFVVGVHTHWVNNGIYQTGLFHTIELEEWND